MSTNVLVPSSLSISTGQATMANSLPVVVASDQSVIGVKTTDLSSITQSLNMTSTSNAVTLSLGTGQAVAYVQITGATWTGTIIFEGNVDGSNWFTINAVVPTSGAIATTTTANGQWQLPVGGLASVRIRCSVTGTNSATVSVEASRGSTVVSMGAALPTGSNTIGAVTQASGPWTSNITQVGGSSLALGQTTMSASLPVTFANNQSVLGANISQVGGSSVALGQTTQANSIPVVLPNNMSLATSGGSDGYRILSANNTTTLTIKSSAGQLYWIHATNTNASVRYLKLYNSTSASVGTTTPLHTYVIPGNANGAGFTISIPCGEEFGTGIQAGITTGIADGDTGAPAANEVVVNLGYK